MTSCRSRVPGGSKTPKSRFMISSTVTTAAFFPLEVFQAASRSNCATMSPETAAPGVMSSFHFLLSVMIKYQTS